MPVRALRTTILGASIPALLSLAITAALVENAEAGAAPPIAAAAPEPPSYEGIWLAGSGSNVQVVRALAAAYHAAQPSAPRLRVHPSVGSGGGLRALRDGVIDAALVSRPLRPREREGVRALCFAEVPVVFAAHSRVREPALSRAALVAAYRGERTRWPSGEPLVVLQREPGDSSHAAVRRAWPDFAAADEESARTHRFEVLFNDRAMFRALSDTEGSVGLFDLGQIEIARSRLQTLAIDGVSPSVAALEEGRYPFAKTLAIVVSSDGTLEAPLAGFLDFVASAPAAAELRARGYVPLVRCPEGDWE